MAYGIKIGVSSVDENYLFAPNYVPIKLDESSFQKTLDAYVSEGIKENDIEQWKGSKERPVFISAQTGSGKNYFVTHNLREYAKRNGERILYISNRVALDYQQKKELARLTHAEFKKTWTHEDVSEDFSNVTVVTYHKLLHYFGERKDDWFSNFTYVVIDECHFFYSDSLFNPYTEYILGQIVKKFRNSVRIYMSATFEDVLDPIFCFESGGRALPYSNSYRYDCVPYVYHFHRDFSTYQCRYFSETKQIISQIEVCNKKEKWIIFVTSKEEGKRLCKELNAKSSNSSKKGADDVAVYLDSESRNSSDAKAKILWEELQKEGKSSKRIVITTSVLDNGFSIKDSQVKNIVLYTHDKTEFLQELGRCRISKDDKINLYIKKMSKKGLANAEQFYDKYMNLFFSFCGEPQEKDSINTTPFLKQGNPARTAENLWSTREDSRRGPIALIIEEIKTNDKREIKRLKPVINRMAWWRALQTGRKIEEFKKLQEQAGEDAGIIYKARWLCCDASPEIPSIDVLNDRDLDKTNSDERLRELREFLNKEAEKNIELIEGKNEFESFSREFMRLYGKACPKDKSFNRGKDRPVWKHEAIHGHLEKLLDPIDKKPYFTFEEGSCKGAWILHKKTVEDVTEQNTTPDDNVTSL